MPAVDLYDKRSWIGTHIGEGKKEENCRDYEHIDLLLILY
jgi:hypothetical protein